MKLELIGMFNTTAKEFIDKIIYVFPEININNDEYNYNNNDITLIDFFGNTITKYGPCLSKKQIDHNLTELFIFPKINLIQIINLNPSPKTIDAMWRYIHTLMLIYSTYNAPNDNLEEIINDWSKVLEADNNEVNGDFLESVKQQAETLFNLLRDFNDDDDTNMFADLDEETGINNDTQSENNDDDSSDDDFNPIEKLENSKVGKLAKELADEVDVNDFISGVKPSSNPKDAFKNILGNDPKKLLNLIKTVSDKVKSKLASGEINEPELVEEVQDMVSSLKKNKKFKKACKKSGMGDILNKAMNGDINDNNMSDMMNSMMSGRRPKNNTSTRDRLKKKLEQKQKQSTKTKSIQKQNTIQDDIDIDEMIKYIES